MLSSYLWSFYVLDLGLVEARTVATTVLILVGLYLIVVLEASGRVRAPAVIALCLTMLALYGVVLALPGMREFFELAVPGVTACLTALGGAGLAVAGLWLTDERFTPGGEARLGSTVLAAEVDEPVDRADHEPAADDVPESDREEVVEEEAAPRQA